jgi:anti-sigma regulatory factor (Ser/Thr protein kinase)
MTNLLNNAAKYTDPGGSIAIIVDRSDDGAVVRVRDTGIGVKHASHRGYPGPTMSRGMPAQKGTEGASPRIPSLVTI